MVISKKIKTLQYWINLLGSIGICVCLLADTLHAQNNTPPKMIIGRIPIWGLEQIPINQGSASAVGYSNIEIESKVLPNGQEVDLTFLSRRNGWALAVLGNGQTPPDFRDKSTIKSIFIIKPVSVTAFLDAIWYTGWYKSVPDFFKVLTGQINVQYGDLNVATTEIKNLKITECSNDVLYLYFNTKETAVLNVVMTVLLGLDLVSSGVSDNVLLDFASDVMTDSDFINNMYDKINNNSYTEKELLIYGATQISSKLIDWLAEKDIQGAVEKLIGKTVGDKVFGFVKTLADITATVSDAFVLSSDRYTQSGINGVMLSTGDCLQAFPDVKYKEWFYPYVSYLKSNSVISGYPDGNFHPNDQVTRAEFLKMALVGKFGSSKFNYIPSTAPFSDVAATAWYAPYVAFAAKPENAFVAGYSDGTFKPDELITRAEAAKLIALIFSLPTSLNGGSWSDVSSSDWYTPYLKTVSSNSASLFGMTSYLMQGYKDGTFKPNQLITRAEVAKIVALAMNLKKNIRLRGIYE